MLYNCVLYAFYKYQFLHILYKTIYRQETFNETRIVISGLNAVTTYRFQIFAENGVSHLTMRSNPEYADVVITTEASVASSITNIRVTSVKSTEITLAWDAPITDGDLESDQVETYEVRLVSQKKTLNLIICIKLMSIFLDGFLETKNTATQRASSQQR